MLGGGTRTAITTDKARCLDLTRLISRVGRGALTGVDRVEAAYLTELLQNPSPFHALVKTALGYVLLDRAGAMCVADRLFGRADWGQVDLVGRVSFKASPAKRRAEADLRRFALGRCHRRGLTKMLSRHLPTDIAYLNVGHSNLTQEVLGAWRGHGAQISVLVHDTIPLDYPDFQRPGTPALFKEKLQRVAEFADLVICNSQQTQRDVTRWFAAWGKETNTVVAHLGVDMPLAAPSEMPLGIDLSKPFFVTVGTIEPRKNHALLLDVWEQMAKERLPNDMPTLIIAGARGWANEEVFQRLDTSALIGTSIFERADLSDAQLSALMSQANAVLFPSFAEGYGLPPAEAILTGTHTICSDLPVFHEILGRIPVYLKPDDVYSWKQSIIGSMGLKSAGQQRQSKDVFGFKLPTWADHFNLILRRT